MMSSCGIHAIHLAIFLRIVLLTLVQSWYFLASVTQDKEYDYRGRYLTMTKHNKAQNGFYYWHVLTKPCLFHGLFSTTLLYRHIKRKTFLKFSIKVTLWVFKQNMCETIGTFAPHM